MSQATDTVVVTTAVAVAKAPSKKSLALAIFSAKLLERSQGLFASNREFRAAVLSTIEADLGVSQASAATMFNAAKKEAEAADATVGLGRDPKKAKTPSTGKRGRPAGSKNKEKEVLAVEVIAAEVITPVASTEVATADGLGA